MLCVVIAVLALALANTTQEGMPPAATVAEKASPCPSDLGSVCQSSAEAAKEKPSTVAGLHRLMVLRPGGRRRG